MSKQNELEVLNKYLNEERWNEAARLIRRLLVKEPDDHWLLARLSNTYYERRQYERALELAEAALEISPNCQLALGDYATALDMLGESEEAILAWKKVVTRGVESVAFGDCGEGLRHAKVMITDYYFRIAQSYADIERKALARRYMDKYFEMRKTGVRSQYGLREAKRIIKELDIARKESN